MHISGLREQAQRLGDYCIEHGIEVVECAEDPGISGAAFDRPGLNRVRELVAGGGVDLVLATERDRFAREPAYLYLLRKEFSEHGTTLRALNQQGDDSPIGELTDGMLDQIGKFFRSTFAAKSMENKRKKAREGQASGSGKPPSGFRYAEDRRSLEVDEATMVTVRRVFGMVAEGATLHSVCKALDRDGVPTFGRGERWYTVSLSRIIHNDAYLPHTFGELREAGVEEPVLATLDPDALYGTLWYGRNRVELTPDSKNRRKQEELPRSAWVPIPAPDAGIPKETVLAARKALERTGKPRPNARHRYELAGAMYCAACGLRMTGYSTGDGFRYYTCQRRRKWGRTACPEGPLLNASKAEQEILEWAEGMLSDPDALTAKLEEAVAAERRTVQEPGTTERALAERLTELSAKEDRLLDLAADGMISKDKLSAKLEEVRAEAASLNKELERVRGSASRLAEMEATKRTLLEAFGNGLRLGVTWMPPLLRREIYEAIGLHVTVHADGGMRAEARLDRASLRYSREVERYAERLREAERRVVEAPADRTEDERRERIERELAQVRRDLSSPDGTDTVMAEVAG